MLLKRSLTKYICINAFDYNAIIVYVIVLKPGTPYLAWQGGSPPSRRQGQTLIKEFAIESTQSMFSKFHGLYNWTMDIILLYVTACHCITNKKLICFISYKEANTQQVKNMVLSLKKYRQTRIITVLYFSYASIIEQICRK